MAEMIVMPKLGMDMEEGTILRWMKKEGDPVKKGEPVAEIETDKTSMELESPADGVVLKLLIGEGESIAVKEPVAVIGQPGEMPELPSGAPGDSPAAAKMAEPSSAAAPAVSPAAASNVPSAAPAAVSAAPAPAYVPSPGFAPEAGGKVKASPRARRLAEKENVPLGLLSGSGPGGRIKEKDVRAWIAAGRPGFAGIASGQAAFGAFSFAGNGKIQEDRVVPLTGIRKVIASRMHQSLSESAQANHRMDADMGNMKELRAQLNRDPRFAEKKISFMDLMTACCARAIADCPYVNVSLEEAGIHEKAEVSIGIAVDTPRGLVVPVLKNAAALDIAGISAESAKLIGKARDGKLLPDDMSGGTFTISNLGMFGLDSFTAILNPPETCILAVGRIADRVVPVDGKPGIRPMVTLSLTYDHRLIDGAPAARFLQRIAFYMENPALVLLPR